MMDLNRAVKAYLNLREAKTQLKRKFDEEEAVLKGKMERLEAEFLRTLNEQGTESMRTLNGTFFRQEEITPTCQDWDALYRWIKQEDAFEALERRVKKTFVKDWMDQHEGTPPPGVNVFREFVVRVRRPT